MQHGTEQLISERTTTSTVTIRSRTRLSTTRRLEYRDDNHRRRIGSLEAVDHHQAGDHVCLIALPCADHTKNLQKSNFAS